MHPVARRVLNRSKRRGFCRWSGRVGRRGGQLWRCLRRAAAADPELVALLRRGAEEAGEPGERDAEGSSVAEVDPHAVVVEADVHCGGGCANGNSHSMLFRYGPCCLRLSSSSLLPVRTDGSILRLPVDRAERRCQLRSRSEPSSWRLLHLRPVSSMKRTYVYVDGFNPYYRSW